MSNKAKFTKGQIEIVGTTHLVIFGERGGNICSMSSPRRESSVDYHRAKIGDKDFNEAAANAERIKRCWNSHDALYAVARKIKEEFEAANSKTVISQGAYEDLRAALKSASPETPTPTKE